MKTEKEELLKETYDKFLNLMLYDYPLDRMEELIADDVMGYGTTLDEKILNITRLRKLVIDQREQGAGAKIFFDVKKVFRRLTNNKEAAIFVDEIKISLTIDGAKNEIPLRISSVFYYLNEKWMLVHLHGSVAVETEGDTWHINEWKQKNAELEKLVNEKTSELINKNRELEIETALEKVRSSALSMKRPGDMVEVCRIISDQLHTLGVSDIRNVQTAIINEQKGTYLNYQYFIAYDKSAIEEAEYNKHPKAFEMAQEMKKSVEAFFSESFYDEELNVLREYRKQDNQFPDPILDESTSLHFYFYSIGPGALGLSTYNTPLSESDMNILKRFRNVFELAYRRFMDIEQAIAQAREAQIEAALEKVRAVAMSMNKPDDLLNICEVSFKEFQKLGFKNIRNALIHIPNDEQKYFMDYDFSELIGGAITKIEYGTHPIVDDYIKKIRSAVDAYFEVVIDKDQLKGWLEFRRESGQKDDPRLDEATAVYLYFFSIGIGDIGISTFEPIDELQINILKRFRNVFDLAYRRYSDITKAEAQARESQIQLALERVRARTMGMQHSDELQDAAVLMFQQIESLGVDIIGCGFNIWDDDRKEATAWMSGLDRIQPSFKTSGSKDIFLRINEAAERGESLFVEEQAGEELVAHYQYMASIPVFRKILEGLEAKGLSAPSHQVMNCTFFSQGYLMFITPAPAESAYDIFKRFAKVFEQTYTRFLDLQKAEAQAREAEIQLALERVRARTMAMHKSDELAETAAILFQQMTELGVTPERLNICLIKEADKILEVWATDQKGVKISHHFNASLDEPTTGKRVYDAWKEKKKSVIIDLSGKELNDWIRYVREVMGMTIKEELVKEHRIHSVAFFSHGMVLTTTPEPLPEESMKLLERFADVFNLTYRRFLDLQQAEEQTREAKIEAALERVRAKAMAMHSSDDLAFTVDTFFSELNVLNVMPHRCGVGIINLETRIVDINATTATQENEVKKITGKLKLSGHPVLDKIFENWKLQKEYHPILRGKEILEYYQVMNPQVQFPDFANDETQYGYYFFFKEGGVFGWTEKELTESDLKIFRRFTSVLSLTYRRYLDLKESEARTLEAIKKSSLDRVRAEIASMRSTDDLNRITPIIWRELKTLDVPFFRCGVFIVDEGKSKVQVYLTTPDGKSLGVLNLPFNSNELTSNTVEFWRRKEVYKEHWNKEEFISWSKSMLKLGQIKSQQEYQGAEQPPESLDLHFIPFEQGMLYVGNKEPLASEKIDLVKSLAEAFSIAYARYEDFDRLEVAKREVESAFSDLDIISKELKIKNEELENENRRKELELEEARQLQLSMLPKALPKLPNLDIAVYMKTATEVGGDYYDFHIQSDGTLNILIGDATGHGMKSGMMVSIMKSFFIANRSNISLKQFFDSSNDSIKNMQLGRLMMALMGVQITSKKVIATNAGMPSLVYFRNKSQKAGEFVINNFPLGAMKDNKYSLKEISYESGDTLLMMSDGFGELKNEKDEQYGYPRIIKEFKSVVQKSPNEIVDHLKNSALEWSKGSEPDDDVTFVVIKVK